MKWPIIALMVVVMALGVLAQPLPMCDYKREINTNCAMTSPTINCTSPTYSIINLSGTQVEYSNMTPLNNNVYYFNFTQGEGDYVVQLCDLTTREVRVIEEDEGRMIIAALIFAPLVLGLFFVFGAWSMGTDHPLMRLFLFLLSIISFFSSMHFGAVAVVKFYNMPEMEELIASTTYWVGWVLFIIVSYYSIYTIKIIIDAAAQKKEKRLEY
jgi:hypothetical protein